MTVRENSAKNCVICRRVVGKAYRKPDPPTLPKGQSPCYCTIFSTTGVDFAGHMYLKTAENTKMKIYLS